MFPTETKGGARPSTQCCRPQFPTREQMSFLSAKGDPVFFSSAVQHRGLVAELEMS